MWFLCAANVTKILLNENAGIPHFIPSVAPGAALRMHARISFSFFRAGVGAASIYSVTLVGLDFFAVMGLHSIDSPAHTPEQPREVNVAPGFSPAHFPDHPTQIDNTARWPRGH